MKLKDLIVITFVSAIGAVSVGMIILLIVVMGYATYEEHVEQIKEEVRMEAPTVDKCDCIETRAPLPPIVEEQM